MANPLPSAPTASSPLLFTILLRVISTFDPLPRKRYVYLPRGVQNLVKNLVVLDLTIAISELNRFVTSPFSPSLSLIFLSTTVFGWKKRFLFFFLNSEWEEGILLEYRMESEIQSFFGTLFFCTVESYFQGRSELKCRENCARVRTMEGFCLNRDYDFTSAYPASDIFILLHFPSLSEFSSSEKILRHSCNFLHSSTLSHSSPPPRYLSDFNSTTRSIKFRIAITRTSEKLINETRRPSMLYVREISPSASNYRANYPGRKRNLLEPANLSPPPFRFTGDKGIIVIR